jgi:uncharacterized protein (DUF58 family)
MFAAGLAALTLSSWGAAFFSLRKVSVHRGSNNDGTVDKFLDLPIIVENQSRLSRLPIVIEEILPFLATPRHVTTTPGLSPGSKQVVNRHLLPCRRGDYNLNELQLIGGDPAGLFNRRRCVSIPRELLINPPSVPLSWLPLKLRRRIDLSSTGRPIGVSGVGQEFFGLREYRPSDGFRFIHWRASAKHAKLMVRQFEENSAKQVSLFLDSEATAVTPLQEPEAVSNFEFQIKTAATLTNYLSGTYSNLLFSSGAMAASDVRIDAAASLAPEIIYHLACLQAGDRTVADQLDECFELILPHSILYCLTLSESPALMNQFDLLQTRGVEIRWLHAPPEAFQPSLMPPPKTTRPLLPVAPVDMEPDVNIAAVLTNA